ncbi:conserved Plasmodium protein, unknown function [Plasmodium vinckei lentum]|uniref:MgsA AAA+ ATPase C-terminal domain-containing protein n=1 Tax=Plasmodium vinckei lentum TaxID=138297 RepID=A0A6V7S5Y5_PLAVN|nr:conserved Plasmodium protein, unknown function [Plasmodium vinckei lentum]
MKRKSPFVKKNPIKAQNTLDKFGIFKKAIGIKKEDEKEHDINKNNMNTFQKKEDGNILKIKKEKYDGYEDNLNDIEDGDTHDGSKTDYNNTNEGKEFNRESPKNEKDRGNDVFKLKMKSKEGSDLNNSNSVAINEKEQEETPNNTNPNSLPLHKLYQPIYKEDYIHEIRSKRNPLLTKILDEDLNFNLILCGPPGSGKSSLINVIKNKTHNLFITLFHLNNFNTEIRRIYDQSIINYKLSKRRMILCIKDINRLNKPQQEHLLLVLKKGYFYLLATCLYNPMNILNASLSSRCLYLYLSPYDKIELALIIKRIINKLNIEIEDNALNVIISHSSGDARVAINIIDFAIQHMRLEEMKEKERLEKEKQENKDGIEKKNDTMIKQVKVKRYNEYFNEASNTEPNKKIIQINNIKNFLQNFPCNDNKLDHYNFISGLHKSIRAGNVKAAILYLTKSLKNGEDPLYICRRLIRIASEDIGIANHKVLSVCVNTHYACKAIGMPECQTALIYAVIVLCKSSKSNYIYVVEKNAKKICNEYSFDVPFHLRNTSNRYIYTNQPEILTFEEHTKKYKAVQKYLPDYIENVEVLPEI